MDDGAIVLTPVIVFVGLLIGVAAVCLVIAANFLVGQLFVALIEFVGSRRNRSAKRVTPTNDAAAGN